MSSLSAKPICKDKLNDIKEMMPFLPTPNKKYFETLLKL